ncbi:MAG: hypothetical protein JSR42_12390 [Proteobacteria bacterium]|nr:hypothetical protein [Pseudomonadota bacterium]
MNDPDAGVRNFSSLKMIIDPIRCFSDPGQILGCRGRERPGQRGRHAKAIGAGAFHLRLRLGQ